MHDVRKTTRNPEIDGLRAVCVLIVVMAHLIDSGHVMLPFGLNPSVSFQGHLAVEFFLVLSGFLITSLHLKEHLAKGRINLLGYYIRRFFRIIPAYWTYLATVTLLAATGFITLTPQAFTRAVFFITDINFLPEKEAWFVGHSWTLSVQEQYYTALPFFLWVVLKGKRRAMLIMLGVLYLFTTYIEKANTLHPPVPLAFLGHFKFIIAGVVLALVWHRTAFLFERVSVTVPLLLVTLLATRDFYTDPSHAFLAKLVTPTEAIAEAYILGWIILNPAWCGFLHWRVTQALGRCSYSIFLWQEFFTGRVDFYHRIDFSALPWSLAGLAICVALSYYLIEVPTMRLGARLSKRIAVSRDLLAAPAPTPTSGPEKELAPLETN